MDNLSAPKTSWTPIDESVSISGKSSPVGEIYQKLLKWGFPVPEAYLVRLQDHDFDDSGIRSECAIDIMKKYNHFFQGQWVKIDQSLPVRGDTNVVLQIHKSLSNRSQNLIVIEAAPQPDFSGILITCNPTTGSKDQVYLEVSQGVFDPHSPFCQSDQFSIETKTNTVIEQSVSSHTTYLSYGEDGYSKKQNKIPKKDLLKPPVREAVITSLLPIKKHFFYHVILHWRISKNYLEVTSVEKFGEDYTLPIQSISKKNIQSGSIAGKMICPGRVGGKLVFFQENKPISQAALRSQSSILFIKKLMPEHQSLLSSVSGIICESSLPSAVLVQRLQKYGIPCIAGVTKASQRLKQGLLVELNAVPGIPATIRILPEKR